MTANLAICKRTGKLAYASAREAHAHLRAMHKHHHRRRALHVYRCPACGAFHHGTTFGGTRRG